MPARFSPSCAAKNRPSSSDGPIENSVQHDRRADRRIVRRAEEHRRAEAKRLVKAADRAGRRHGDADHEQRDQRNEPVNGTASRNATATGPDAERDRQPQRKRPAAARPAGGRAAGWRRGRRELLGDRARAAPRTTTAAPARAASASGRAAPGRPPGRTARPARTSAPPPAVAAGPLRPAANATGFAAVETRGRRRTRRTPAARAPSRMSSRRSRMIVANAPVALMRSWRARKYGRMTSPARAGSTLLAANPTAVARNALPNVVVPERLEQVLPAPAPGSPG